VRLGPILLLQLPGPQWILKQSWRSIANKRVNGAEKPMARTGSFNASSMCIGNNRSTVMTRRKRAESTRTDRNWSRIVRRMVVVSCAEKSVKRTSFATHPHQRKFVASLAVAAVHRKPFSTRIPC